VARSVNNVKAVFVLVECSIEYRGPEGGGGEPLDDNYGINDIDAETLVEMALDCQKFQKENWLHIGEDNVAVESDHSCHARAGHDFWLTRNGHGAGFWDGDWKEPAATKLDEASKKFGEYNITASGKKGDKVSKM